MQTYLNSKCIAFLGTLLISCISYQTANAAGAEEFLAAGQKSFAQKKYAQGIKHLTKAINSGNLSPKDVAKALHYRGQAYYKNGEPARSIADLTRALFFKKLAPQERSQILQNRAIAYQSVGLTSRAEADLRAAGKSSISVARATPQKQRNTRKTRPNLRLSTANQRKPRKPKRTVVSSGWGASVSSATPTQTYQRQQNAQPSQPSTYSTASIRPQQRATTAQASTASASTSGWGSTQTRSKPVSYTTTASTTPPATTGAGRYRLQLAAFGSPQDANRAWAQMSSQHGDVLSRYTPQLQTANLGQRVMYRLQIGPFTDKRQTLRLCNSLKQRGLNCFLVVR